MECGLSFPSEDVSSHSFTFIFALSLFLFSCLALTLLSFACSLFSFAPYLFCRLFFLIFSIFSPFSLSLYFVLLCSFSILSREVSASSLCLPSLCATSQPVLIVFKVFKYFFCEMFVVFWVGGGPAEMRKIQWFCPTSGITSEVLAC